MLPKGTNVVTPELCSAYDVYKIKEAVLDVALKDYEAKIARLKEDGLDFGDFERLVLLKTVDAKWMDHIDAMDALRKGIGLRGYGQRDPVIAYRQEGWDMFDDMVSRIHSETASILLKVQIEKREDGSTSAKQQIASASKTVRNNDQKVGRNDPCPCGSGLKYKNCCGKK
jgi:preprotein translocase subunit SecA